MIGALNRFGGRTVSSLRKHRNFRVIFVGLVFSHVGSWMQHTALAWFVVELTRSPVALGVLAFCRFMPFTVFGLFAGVTTDRYDNRRLLITTQTASMLVAVALAVLAFSGHAELWHAYVLTAIAGTAHVFDRTVRTSFTYQMVGRDDLPNAVALNSSVFNSARITGPAVAGIVIASFGVSWAFAINALSFVAVLGGLFLIRVHELVPLEGGGERPTIFRGIREGLAYAVRDTQVRTVIVLLIALTTLGFQFHVLVPVIAANTLGRGPEVFGVISACFGVGAVVGGILTASTGRAGFRTLLAASTGLAAGMIALAPQQTVLGVALLLFVIGVFFVLWTANSEAILQITAPDHLRGRVMGLYMFFFGGLVPVGALLSGWLAEIGGSDLALYVGGGAIAVVTALAIPTVTGTDRLALRLRRRTSAGRRALRE